MKTGTCFAIYNAMKTLIMIFLLTLISCGAPEATYTVKPAKAESYNYELKESGCSTGSHSFATLKQTCEALRDDITNNDCAQKEREDLFTNHNCLSLLASE